MYIIITFFVLVIAFALVNFLLPEATGAKGCLIFFIVAIIVIFFMGSCVRLVGAM